jgi:hypothetical protein
MYISPSVLFPNVQSPLCVLHPLLRVCTVVHRLPADSPALLTPARFTAR